MIDQKFWQGKRVFLTGHTGFKGSWLSLWLSSLGAEVRGYALNPPTSPSLFNEAELFEYILSQLNESNKISELQLVINGLVRFDIKTYLTLFFLGFSAP